MQDAICENSSSGIFGRGQISVSSQVPHCSALFLLLISQHQSEHCSPEKFMAAISQLFQALYKSYWQLFKKKNKKNPQSENQNLSRFCFMCL